MFWSCLVFSAKITGKDIFKAASPLYNTEGISQGELKETSKKFKYWLYSNQPQRYAN